MIMRRMQDVTTLILYPCKDSQLCIRLMQLISTDKSLVMDPHESKPHQSSRLNNTKHREL